MLKKSKWHEPFYIWNSTVTLDSQRKTNEHKSSGKCHQLAAELVWNPGTLREAFGNVNRMEAAFCASSEYITNQLKYNSSYCMCLHPQLLRHFSLRYIESVEDSINFCFSERQQFTRFSLLKSVSNVQVRHTGIQGRQNHRPTLKRFLKDP